MSFSDLAATAEVARSVGQLTPPSGSSAQLHMKGIPICPTDLSEGSIYYQHTIISTEAALQPDMQWLLVSEGSIYYQHIIISTEAALQPDMQSLLVSGARQNLLCHMVTAFMVMLKNILAALCGRETKLMNTSNGMLLLASDRLLKSVPKMPDFHPPAL